mgnify:CR=1 FL=1
MWVSLVEFPTNTVIRNYMHCKRMWKECSRHAEQKSTYLQVVLPMFLYWQYAASDQESHLVLKLTSKQLTRSKLWLQLASYLSLILQTHTWIPFSPICSNKYSNIFVQEWYIVLHGTYKILWLNIWNIVWVMKPAELHC